MPLFIFFWGRQKINCHLVILRHSSSFNVAVYHIWIQEVINITQLRIRKGAIEKKQLGSCMKKLQNHRYLYWSNNWTKVFRILSAYKCASCIWSQKTVTFSRLEFLFQMKKIYIYCNITWVRIWWCSRSTRWGKSATGSKELPYVNRQSISPRFVWIMKKDIMNQVWKQSLTQVRFHLEYNYAQQLLRKGTISPFFSGYNQTQEPKWLFFHTENWNVLIQTQDRKLFKTNTKYLRKNRKCTKMCNPL